jgi:hypothetical protein
MARNPVQKDDSFFYRFGAQANPPEEKLHVGSAAALQEVSFRNRP